MVPCLDTVSRRFLLPVESWLFVLILYRSLWCHIWTHFSVESRKQILGHGNSELLNQVYGYWLSSLRSRGIRKRDMKIVISAEPWTTDDAATHRPAQANAKQSATEFQMRGWTSLNFYFIYSAHAKWADWCCINYTV